MAPFKSSFASVDDFMSRVYLSEACEDLFSTTSILSCQNWAIYTSNVLLYSKDEAGFSK